MYTFMTDARVKICGRYAISILLTSVTHVSRIARINLRQTSTPDINCFLSSPRRYPFFTTEMQLGEEHAHKLVINAMTKSMFHQ